MSELEFNASHVGARVQRRYLHPKGISSPMTSYRKRLLLHNTYPSERGCYFIIPIIIK
jgi:hypothetical protein